MIDSTKWIATIPTPSLSNTGKIDIVTELLIPYSDLMSYFLSDIDLRFVRDKEHLPFTNAKPYQSTKDYKRLFDSCKKRYKSQLEKGQTPRLLRLIRHIQVKNVHVVTMCLKKTVKHKKILFVSIVTFRVMLM